MIFSRRTAVSCSICALLCLFSVTALAEPASESGRLGAPPAAEVALGDEYVLQLDVRGTEAVTFTLISSEARPGDGEKTALDVRGWRVVPSHLVVSVDRSASSLAWRSPSFVPAGGWDELEKRFATALLLMLTERVADPELGGSASASDGSAGSVEAADRVAVGPGPVPGTLAIELPSPAVQDLGQITSILYATSPNELTAIAALTAEGLARLDDLGGNSGVRALTAYPFVNASAVVPRDLDAVKSNAVNAAKNLLLSKGPELLGLPREVTVLGEKIEVAGEAARTVKRSAKELGKAGKDVAEAANDVAAAAEEAARKARDTLKDTGRAIGQGAKSFRDRIKKW
jgi:hypothetical protein